MRSLFFTACILMMGLNLIAQSPSAANAEARKLKNPVKASAESIAAGKALYLRNCAFCHGQAGKGDGAVAKATKGTKPSNLADAAWDHGATDGEIFTSIRDGIAPKFEMKASKGRIADQDIWNVVNFLRSLGPTAN